MRIRHGWLVENQSQMPDDAVREYIVGAAEMVPVAIASRLGALEITLVDTLEDPGLASQWKETEDGVHVELATREVSAHDCALELLVCAGQALWERIRESERAAYLRLLRDEIEAGVPGEIDEKALDEKRKLLSNRVRATSARCLDSYTEASFAGSVAEYVHCMWHDVTIRSGSEHLPPSRLRRRLEFFQTAFPPDPGQQLFAAAPR